MKDVGIKQIIGTPLHQNNYIINSPNNELRFNSSMNSMKKYLYIIII